MTSFNRNYLKTLCPNTVALWLRALPYTLGGETQFNPQQEGKVTSSLRFHNELADICGQDLELSTCQPIFFQWHFLTDGVKQSSIHSFTLSALTANPMQVTMLGLRTTDKRTNPLPSERELQF